MSKEMKSVNIGDYLVSKDGKTKYIKLQCSPTADDSVKKAVEDLKKVLGGEILYVNLHTPEFRTEYKIPDFVKGRISMPLNSGESEAPTEKKVSKKKPSDDGVDF